MSVQQKRRTAGSVIASVFLSILLLVPVTTGVFWWELRDIFSQKGIGYCLDRIDPAEIRLSDIGAGREGTLLDQLTDSLNETIGSEVLTAAVLKEKLESSTIKAFVAREAGEILEDFKNGTSRAAITPEELAAFTEENWSLFSDLIPAVSDRDLAAAADMVIAGGAEDTGFAEVARDYLKKHDPPAKYGEMIQTFQQTGKVEEKDRELLIEFMKDVLMPGVYRDRISDQLAGKAVGELNTAYLRRQMGKEAENAVDRAFSMQPLYAVIGVIAVLVLLYFIADRHIPGDAFIGIGALLLTVCGSLALSAFLHPAEGAFRQLAEENYLAYSLSGAFLGFFRTRNLIIAGAGLGLMIAGGVMNGVSRRRSRNGEQPA